MASGTIMGYIGSRQKTETSSLHRVSTRFITMGIESSKKILNNFLQNKASQKS
jgi:hypothetical protein